MQFVYPMLGVILLASVLVYWHALFKFRAIVAAERPEWLMRGRSLLEFKMRMPFFEDPNEAFAVVGIAFGSRWRKLKADFAARYARRIRICLPLFFGVFAVVVVLAFTVG